MNDLGLSYTETMIHKTGNVMKKTIIFILFRIIRVAPALNISNFCLIWSSLNVVSF